MAFELGLVLLTTDEHRRARAHAHAETQQHPHTSQLYTGIVCHQYLRWPTWPGGQWPTGTLLLTTNQVAVPACSTNVRTSSYLLSARVGTEPNDVTSEHTDLQI